jgi:hypothetical protein
MAQIWAPFNLDLESDPVFLKGGYYIRDINNKLSVISLNTMWLSTVNIIDIGDCSDKSSQSSQMLVWFEEQLQFLRNSGKSAYVIGHIPPKDKDNFNIYLPACYQSFLQIVADFTDVILGHYHGVCF